MEKFLEKLTEMALADKIVVNFKDSKITLKHPTMEGKSYTLDFKKSLEQLAECETEEDKTLFHVNLVEETMKVLQICFEDDKDAKDIARAIIFLSYAGTFPNTNEEEEEE